MTKKLMPFTDIDGSQIDRIDLENNRIYMKDGSYYTDCRIERAELERYLAKKT